jgi:hypothetical protein
MAPRQQATTRTPTELSLTMSEDPLVALDTECMGGGPQGQVSREDWSLSLLHGRLQYLSQDISPVAPHLFEQELTGPVLAGLQVGLDSDNRSMFEFSTCTPPRGPTPALPRPDSHASLSEPMTQGESGARCGCPPRCRKSRDAQAGCCSKPASSHWAASGQLAASPTRQ